MVERRQGDRSIQGTLVEGAVDFGSLYGIRPDREENIRRLKKAGFRELASLLTWKSEAELAADVTKRVRQGERDFVLEKYGIRGTVVDKAQLKGIYGIVRKEKKRGRRVDGEKEFVEYTVLTRMGEVFWHLTGAKHFGGRLLLFGVHGLPEEAADLKQAEKTRDIPALRAFDSVWVHIHLTRAFWGSEDKPIAKHLEELPKFDLDIAAAYLGPRGVSMDEVHQFLVGLRYFNPHFKMVAEIVESARKAIGDFVRVDMRTRGILVRKDESALHMKRKEGVRFGHVANMRDSGWFASDTRMVHEVMSGGNTPILMLIPDQEEGFTGVLLDIDPDRATYQSLPIGLGKEVAGVGEVNRRRLTAAIYYFPESAFPVDRNAPAAWDQILKEMQRWAWGDRFPVIVDPGAGLDREVVREVLKSGDEKQLNSLARASAIYLYQKVIVPILDNPKLLEYRTDKLGNARTYFEAMKAALNGDALVSLARYFEAGDDVMGIGVYGMGLFEYLPKMKAFLGEISVKDGSQTRRDRLIGLIREKASSEIGMGWRVFMDFMFEECEESAMGVAEVLLPLGFERGEFVKFTREVLESEKIELDRRFNSEFGDLREVKAETYEQRRVVSLIWQRQKPMATREIARILGMSVKEASIHCVHLRNSRALADISVDLRVARAIKEHKRKLQRERIRVTFDATWGEYGHDYTREEMYNALDLTSRVYVAIADQGERQIDGIIRVINEGNYSKQRTDRDRVRYALRTLIDLGLVEKSSLAGEPEALHIFSVVHKRSS